MRILVSGSSGMIGTAVAAALRGAGHTVHRLARPGTEPQPGDVRWDPVAGELNRPAMEGAEAIAHLAGASIGEGRWTEARKRILRSSRVDAARHLVDEISRLSKPPRVLVSASAIGYYGDRGDEVLTEQSPPGEDFLAALARDWEAEAARAAQFGVRTVMLRFGVVLSPGGGALARMLPPFRLGLGGRLGSGRQWMSWLTLPEAAGILRFAIEDTRLRGPINAVAPHPVRNLEFTKTLGKVLRRPTIFPVPPLALRALLGEMADALLLSSQHVLPQKLEEIRYPFQHPELEAGLRALGLGGR